MGSINRGRLVWIWLKIPPPCTCQFVIVEKGPRLGVYDGDPESNVTRITTTGPEALHRSGAARVLLGLDPLRLIPPH